ncbi:MAG TPA: DUF305 domain-containing protein [Methylomirabilota bacterium]|nr:DUF305 domain-containing protein [Methylomirabilota bacterium]
MKERLFTPRYAMLLLALLIAAVLAAFAASRVASGGAVDDDSADAGFLRDMRVHHDQAVEMALLIRDRTEDPLLHALATDIMLTQQAQVGTMGGWLQIWDLPQTGGEPAMTWMGHPTEGRMPGMASTEEVRQLRELPLAEAEVQFLRLMIRHHAAGVTMAEACLERCDEEVVTTLAGKIINGQQFEIDAMQSMLAERGQEPEPITPAVEATPHDHA